MGSFHGDRCCCRCADGGGEGRRRSTTRGTRSESKQGCCVPQPAEARACVLYTALPPRRGPRRHGRAGARSPSATGRASPRASAVTRGRAAVGEHSALVWQTGRGPSTRVVRRPLTLGCTRYSHVRCPCRDPALKNTPNSLIRKEQVLPCGRAVAHLFGVCVHLVTLVPPQTLPSDRPWWAGGSAGGRTACVSAT
jgi:hypothetical protein